jgi:Domain of unknown function (DUF3332)
MRKVPLRRAVMATVLLSTVATSGCFGSFPLVRKLYTYNKGLSGKWVQELFFLATGVLLPVYGVAGLIDVVILNSQEFWTGKSSVASGPETSTKVLTRGNVTITQIMTKLADAKTMVLEERVDGVLKSRTTVHQPNGAPVVSVETVYSNGTTEKRTLTADEAGKLVIASSNGTRRVLSESEVASLSARFGSLESSRVAVTR